MSDNKEYYSAIKWTWIIIVAAIAINIVVPKLYPRYYFVKNAGIRCNRVTGTVERFDDGDWVNVAESETSRIFRIERKKQEVARAKDMHKRYTEMIATSSDDEDDDDFVPFDEDIDGRRGRGY